MYDKSNNDNKNYEIQYYCSMANERITTRLDHILKQLDDRNDGAPEESFLSDPVGTDGSAGDPSRLPFEDGVRGAGREGAGSSFSGSA